MTPSSLYHYCPLGILFHFISPVKGGTMMLFFQTNKIKWYLVAFDDRTALSGVTFISVPGGAEVENNLNTSVCS
jgi:hypothetical protein